MTLCPSYSIHLIVSFTSKFLPRTPRNFQKSPWYSFLEYLQGCFFPLYFVENFCLQLYFPLKLFGHVFLQSLQHMYTDFFKYFKIQCLINLDLLNWGVALIFVIETTLLLLISSSYFPCVWDFEINCVIHRGPASLPSFLKSIAPSSWCSGTQSPFWAPLWQSFGNPMVSYHHL